ncbi:hypothetical protein GJAV_G00176240 [Gymnothorax javanicus]|nr:hypothetical protein GJAV_G00176240 [Gymnothorax javanicus]
MMDFIELSPAEGRLTNLGNGLKPRPLPSTDFCENAMLTYCRNLSSMLSQVSTQQEELREYRIPVDHRWRITSNML